MPENFNSRLRKETNRNTAPVSRAWKYFNSRLRKETNLKEIVDSGFSIISIHVSARRRTPKKTTESCSCLFQFTSPFGDELLSSLACAKTLQFQITFPCGNERILIVWSTVPENFNSRLRKETNCMPASIHALSYFTFQLTSPRGNERSLRTAYGQGIRPFQFTSPQGDEQEVKPSVDFGWIFQLTSP